MNKILYRLMSVTVTLALALGSFSSAGASTLFNTTSEDASVLAAASPDYLIISRDNLMALPTSGTAWNTIKSSADASATPDLCNQDNKADVNALAAGIVYARTGDAVYRTKVINLINSAIASQRDGCGNAVLAMGRQLGGYVLAADFANYRDPAFVNWLTGIIDRNVGGHSRWYVLRFTAYNSANNWGTFALASVITADIYLNRTADIEKDWQVYSNYGTPHGWAFNKTSDYNEQWSCVTTDSTGKLPIAINSPCVKSGINLDGAPVEDSSRSLFGSYSTYIHESLQGYVVMAQLFERTGRNGWAVNNSQVCRAAKFGDRAGRLNDSSVGYYVAFMANHFCGLNLPTKTPTSGGRIFGFSDWLFGGGSPVPPTSVVTATKTSTSLPTNPTMVIPTFTATSMAPINTPTAGLIFTPTLINTPITLPATPTTVSTGQNTFKVRIAKGMDDVEESSTGKMYVNSSDLELIYDNNAQVIGIRFTGVTIPQGATITNAYIQFKVEETSSTTVKLNIAAEANPNASAFSTIARNVSARPRTSSSVSWTPISWTKAGDMGTAQQTPNLNSIIQEIVSLPKWTSGNSIVIIITGSGGKRVAESYEGNAAGAPLLHIEYSMPALKIVASPTVTATPTLITPLALPTTLPDTFTPVPTQIQVTPMATEVIIPTGTAIPSSPTLEVIIPTETPIPVTP